MVLQLLRLFVRIQRWGNCSKDRSLFAAYFTDCRDTSTWVNTLFNYLAGIGKRCSFNCGRNRASHDLTSLHGPHEMQSKSWWNLFRKLTDNLLNFELNNWKESGSLHKYFKSVTGWHGEHLITGSRQDFIRSLGHDRISLYCQDLGKTIFLLSPLLRNLSCFLQSGIFFRFWYVYARQQWVSPKTQRIAPFS